MTFVVYRSHGTGWNPNVPMREQAAWPEHAEFMNELARQGFVVVGGVIGDGERTLLVIEASSADAIRERLALDPWSSMQILRVDGIEPWEILLGTLRAI